MLINHKPNQLHMTYFSYGATLFALIFIVIRWRRYQQKKNFDQHLNMLASIFLSRGSVDKQRVQGSLIMELQRYDSELRNIYITDIKFKNPDIQIKYFNGLLFEVNKQGSKDLTSLSIGIRLPKDVASIEAKNNEHLHIQGKFYFTDKTMKRFRKTISIQSIRHS